MANPNPVTARPAVPATPQKEVVEDARACPEAEALARKDTVFTVSCAVGATKAMQLPAERANAVADATRPAMISARLFEPILRAGTWAGSCQNGFGSSSECFRRIAGLPPAKQDPPQSYLRLFTIQVRWIFFWKSTSFPLQCSSTNPAKHCSFCAPPPGRIFPDPVLGDLRAKANSMKPRLRCSQVQSGKTKWVWLKMKIHDGSIFPIAYRIFLVPQIWAIDKYKVVWHKDKTARKGRPAFSALPPKFSATGPNGPYQISDCPGFIRLLRTVPTKVTTVFVGRNGALSWSNLKDLL